VLGKRKDSDLRIHNMFLRFPLTPHYLRPTSYDKKFTLCSMRSALCCMKMAQDRMEGCLQAVA